jgi:serine phosphatase RsbU (regulator of sigma subunit)
MPTPWFLAAVALGCGIAALLWGRAALFRMRFLRRVDRAATDPEARWLASGALARDIHVTGLYLVIAVTAATWAITDNLRSLYLLGLVAVPVIATIWLARYARRDARLEYVRLDLERRAQQVLTQEESAPRRWAERLAPHTMPEIDGVSIATAHQAGTGMMSGDLIDVFQLPSGRLCTVVGDVTGMGVEASITALQVKYLLRSYLRRFRDPGQALEELNSQLVDFERPEDYVSIFVAVFDLEANTIRYASAGHPAGWHCSERVPRALRSTGPLLMMDGQATFLSSERPFVSGDVVLLSTDGLLEARHGDQFFGEERVASTMRRDADVEPDVLCKTLVDAAIDFVQGSLQDDVSILAVRRR